MSARERRPNATVETEVRAQDRAHQKGTYGRHTALRYGDCFRDLISRSESPKGKARDLTRTEALRRHVTCARLWGRRGVQENGLAGRIPIMAACGFVDDVVEQPQ